MKAKTLHICNEEIVSHSSLLENGERSFEARVIIEFKDEDGNYYGCNKVIKCRVVKEKKKP